MRIRSAGENRCRANFERSGRRRAETDDRMITTPAAHNGVCRGRATAPGGVMVFPADRLAPEGRIFAIEGRRAIGFRCRMSPVRAVRASYRAKPAGRDRGGP